MFYLLLGVIYIAFIGLGMPDAMLGAAWPSMYPDLSAPISYAGILSMLIAAGTVFSSLQSDRMTKKFGAGLVTLVSVTMTAVGLAGFAISPSFWVLCLFAIPYGLGAGSVDAALNNYVALHYESCHMSWLHCMWGVGATVGPYIMGYALTQQSNWRAGFWHVATIQFVIVTILLLTLSVWNKQKAPGGVHADVVPESLSLKQIFAIRGAKPVMLMFFGYCALEQTAGLWASSYLVLHKGVATEQAASWAALYFMGIMIGRAGSGFLTMKFSDNQMIRGGFAVIGIGVLIMFLPLGHLPSLIGLLLIGLGSAPIYPCVIHSTPVNFGATYSQAITGVQMASAYIGTLTMPPLFGLIANHINIGLYPLYLGLLLVLMFVMHQRLLAKQ